MGRARGEARYRAAEAALAAHHGVRTVERWLDLPRLGVRVRLLEVGRGAPALFLHGAQVAGACWLDLAGRLQDGVRCLLLDRPGCGLSEPVDLPSGVDGLPDHADALAVDVLDALGIDQAHLVSNSLGGYLALRAAAAHPDRIARIVHHGWSLGAPMAEPVPLTMRLAGLPGVGWLMARVPVSRGAARLLLRHSGMGESLDAGRIPEVGIAWNAALLTHTATRQREYRFVKGAPVTELIGRLVLPADVLERVAAPVRVCWGTEDPFATTATMQALVDGLPDAELVIMRGAGHAPWLDDLDRAAALTSTWLTGAHAGG